MDMAPDPGLHARTGHGDAPVRWANLAADAAEPNIFYTPELLVPAIDHLAGEAHIHVLEAHADGRSIGLLPIVAQRRHGRLPVANVSNWMHRHCFYGAPLLRRGQEQAAWESLLAQLDAAAWAPGFLHLSGIDAAGPVAAALEAVCVGQRRGRQEIARYDRALLRSPLGADDYWETQVRPKKRKEIRRLQKRLAELGTLTSRRLTDPADLPRWCGDFLKLEEAGWKGANGTALASSPQDTAFFRAATAAAMASGKLCFLRLDLDGAPIAMLVNFVHGTGGFSFKIAFDEVQGRFSPGVLIEIDNLAAVQDDHVAAWMDSCATPDHPMIDSLWAERRSIAQYRVALKGPRRALAFAAANSAEGLSRRIRGR
jgi:CelD/BcsL family acetyltransferase involved in cellulose biosynthesis